MFIKRKCNYILYYSYINGLLIKLFQNVNIIEKNLKKLKKKIIFRSSKLERSKNMFGICFRTCSFYKMLYLTLFLSFIAFPKRDDAIFHSIKDKNKIKTEVSGSMGYYTRGKCLPTYANSTLNEEDKQDWCSNIAKNGNEKPFIMYSIEGKSMKLTGYAVRNGCCYYACCCLDDNNLLDGDRCCCRLYSFSLLGSNDNKTWTTLHSIERAEKFYYCSFRTYEINNNQAFKYIRFVQDEQLPNCAFCMQINQIELYGSTISAFDDFSDDNDEGSISIIGKINRNNID